MSKTEALQLSILEVTAIYTGIWIALAIAGNVAYQIKLWLIQRKIDKRKP